MNRQTETDDHNRANASRNTGDRARTPEEIERDIAAIRARMDRTLDELEFRLSPGQITSGVIDLAQDVIRGNPGRLSEAIRNNPLPVALIGIGVLWLGIAMARTRPSEVVADTHEHLPSPGEIENALSPLIQLNRQGADGLRQAEGALTDPQIRTVVREASEVHDRAAQALESELRRFGITPTTGAMAPTSPHPAWSELRRALTTRETGAIIAAAESGEDAALQAFRDVLHRDLPADTRVLVGAHFHATEQIHNRISALKQAVA